MIVEVQPQSWRLLVNGGDVERVLVEAVPGEPLRYVSSFGARRHLPESGVLASEDIQRIVLGWSEKDAAWHLGLVLRGDLASERGSRWCGLVHWHDPFRNQFQDAAAHAGQTLADQIARPFTLIPPKPLDGDDLLTAQPDMLSLASLQPESAPEPILIPQPNLPLTFDLWTLRQLDPARLELALSPSWGRGKLLRVAWNILWLGVFVILTVTTLTSGIALPRPELLVYLGFVSIAILVVVIFYNLYQTATYPNRIVIEPAGVRWLRGQRVLRTIPIDQIAGVYVSHIVSKVGKRADADRTVRYGEMNLYLRSGKFQSLLIQHQTDDRIPTSDDALDEEFVVPLTPYNARTRLQSAGLHVADVLRVPGEYDKRLK